MKIFESSAKRGNVRLRGREFLRAAACGILIAQLAGVQYTQAAGDKSAHTPAPISAASDPVLKAMQDEIKRATAELGRSEQPPYYLSYTVYDQDFVVLVGAYGSLLTDTVAQRRFADVNMRVGAPELDNTHGQSRPSGVNSGSLPLGNDPDAIARVLWELTDREYKRAVPSLLSVRTNTAGRAGEEKKLTGKIEKMAADLSALRKAPVAEPYDGPAVLSGRAAAVFFHEVLGHRLEGHRQRDEEEGQTFTKKIGQEVLPKFLSVMDDPTTHEMAGIKLAGSYDFDNEGEPAQRVEVIKDGVLQNFLMSRMPVKNFNQSNGHGRNQPGRMPTGRQGNLIVTSTKAVPEAEMRQKLIEEVKKQGKPYGLYFDDIQGGFTLTTRALPQAFQVLPVIVYKVYADGRPDELVRGVDIVGTPLAALTRILTTGDQPRVFNGVCGAESGQVPVAAVAPSMLFSEMEVQKRAHEHERPPLLPPPGV